VFNIGRQASPLEPIVALSDNYRVGKYSRRGIAESAIYVSPQPFASTPWT
jgi:hypothetical protein